MLIPGSFFEVVSAHSVSFVRHKYIMHFPIRKLMMVIGDNTALFALVLFLIHGPK